MEEITSREVLLKLDTLQKQAHQNYLLSNQTFQFTSLLKMRTIITTKNGTARYAEEYLVRFNLPTRHFGYSFLSGGPKPLHAPTPTPLWTVSVHLMLRFWFAICISLRIVLSSHDCTDSKISRDKSSWTAHKSRTSTGTQGLGVSGPTQRQVPVLCNWHSTLVETWRCLLSPETQEQEGRTYKVEGPVQLLSCWYKSVQ